MSKYYKVVDDFYENPHEIREFALTQEFTVVGNYPGRRTKPFMNDEIKKALEFHVEEKITNWFDDDGCYTGAFQLTTENDESWVHVDSYNKWAGVLYLTPNAPVSGGTGFFRSKVDGSFFSDNDELSGGLYNDTKRWELAIDVGNIFNRLVLFRGDFWHSSMKYFGTDLSSGRLTQVFFFGLREGL